MLDPSSSQFMWTMVVFLVYFGIPFRKYQNFIKYADYYAGIWSFGLLFWVQNFPLPTFSRWVTCSMIVLCQSSVLNVCVLLCWLLQIKPLVEPTKIIVTMSPITYSWHDLVSKSKSPIFSFKIDGLLLCSIRFYFFGFCLCQCKKNIFWLPYYQI